MASSRDLTLEFSCLRRLQVDDDVGGAFPTGAGVVEFTVAGSPLVNMREFTLSVLVEKPQDRQSTIDEAREQLHALALALAELADTPS